MYPHHVEWYDLHRVLTFCILMEFPIRLNTISMELPILYFKVSQY